MDATSDIAAPSGTGGKPTPENWVAVGDAVRERMRELKMSAAVLARETGLSPTTIRHIGRPGRGHHEHALVAISAVLRWRYDYLTNVLHGQADKNTTARNGAQAGLQRMLRAEVGLLKDDLSRLKDAVHAVGDKISVDQAGPRQDYVSVLRQPGPKQESISDLPMLNDIDADYSPQYVKLARIIRDKIKSGELSRFTILLASNLSAEYQVSAQVAYAAIEMLAANRYIARPEGTRFYRVAWDANHPYGEG